MTREVKQKKPRNERKPRWRTLSPNTRAAKVAAREERKAALEAALARKDEAGTTAAAAEDDATQTSAAGNSANQDQKTTKKPRQGRDRKTARVDGNLPEASSAAEGAAVASAEVGMPDAPEVEVKAGTPEVMNSNNNTNNNTPKKATTPKKSETEAEYAAVENDNGGGVRLLRSRARAH
ncbi:hypothetical protein F4810DRAFT_648626 [Camillea tinctor]|nr:hypothetical protein F4810DRAFT_648626 [Camillea tinctor]